MVAPKVRAEDLDWETPPAGRGVGASAVVGQLVETIAAMRAALTSRRGDWAVLDTFDNPKRASQVANAIAKRRAAGDTRLLHVELAGRRMLDGGSKLYVRIGPA